MRKEPQKFKTRTSKPMDTEMAPKSESTKEVEILSKKPRIQKALNFNAWEKLQNQPAGLTWGEFLTASPMARSDIKTGVITTKEGVITKTVNQVSKKKRNITTSAYASGYIQQHPFIGIIDTGAVPTVLSKTFMDRMGWKIEVPTKMIVINADRSEVTPLGIIKEVPVSFGNVTVTIDMEVVDTESYDILLGND